MEKILIVDDNESIRYTLMALLKNEGFDPHAVDNGKSALKEIRKNLYSLVILDMKLPGMDGMEILSGIRKIDKRLPVIVLTAFGNIRNAVTAIKQGAQEYLTKPFDNDEMILTIKKVLEVKYLNTEVDLLREKVGSFSKQEVIGQCKEMKEVFKQVDIVAPTNFTVLIQGESGTGKEVIANMIHNLSERQKGPMVSVDCGAIPESLIESELFGHEKGAFTDARTEKEGKFELANGGTLFLDEITNLSDSNQIKLLRIVQERKVTRLGGEKPVELDIRIITATNIKLSDAVNNKDFRQDLYYRINEFVIDLPPLRERKDDIPLFVERFIEITSEEMNKKVTSVTPEVMEKLMNHNWPGNVRELRNVIRRAVLLAAEETITSITIPDEVLSRDKIAEKEENSGKPASLEKSKETLEKELILKALKESGGNKSKAAKILKMNERTFYRKIKKLDI